MLNESTFNPKPLRAQAEKPAGAPDLKPDEKVEEVEHEKNIEQELSPEQIEKIMAKVEDINASGNAFSVALLSKLRGILSDGLLGHSYFWPESKGQRVGAMVNKKTWAKNTRVNKNALVHFNITDRMLDEKNSKFPIANSTWMRDDEDDKIAVLFDLSKYKEDAPIADATKDKLGNRTYRIHKHYADEKLADSMYGFTLSHRVPPRFFKGIVIKLVTGEKYKNEYGALRGVECRNPAQYREQANKIGKIMQETYQDENDFLLPIYTKYGGLLWPKYMKHEEVKKFVTERDANVNVENKKE